MNYNLHIRFYHSNIWMPIPQKCGVIDYTYNYEFMSYREKQNTFKF